MARQAKAPSFPLKQSGVDTGDLPRFASRVQLAELHTRLYAPMAPKTLEKWPLAWRTVNGRAVASVAEFLAEAERRFNAAPVIRGGRSAMTEAA